jgi:hypothetical protein
MASNPDAAMDCPIGDQSSVANPNFSLQCNDRGSFTPTGTPSDQRDLTKADFSK